MLPGFNHNIRYKDRVFHVQTEDNGLNQPFLVTQVFIGGHLIAIERTSYADVLEKGLEEVKRNEQIRIKMQDQHKRLLKNLVNHNYDDKIALYLGSQPDGDDDLSAPPIPSAVLAAAEEMPRAETAPEQKAPTGDVVAKSATVMPVADEIPDQKHSPVSGVVKPLDPTPFPGLADDLDAPPEAEDGIQDDDLFKVFDEELQKQVPWSPGNETGSLPPLDPGLFPDVSDERPPPRKPPSLPSAPAAKTESNAPQPRPPRFPDRTTSDQTMRPKTPPLSRSPRRRPPPEAATEVGRGAHFKPPPVSDTLVDFGLPASLKEQLGQAKAALEEAKRKANKQQPEQKQRKSDPRVARFRMPRSSSPTPAEQKGERETQIDLELRRRASSSRGSRPPQKSDSTADTVLDVDAQELRAYIEKKRKDRANKSDGKKDDSWGDAVDDATRPEEQAAEDSKRPNILVVERSLDEVILSYLADED